MTTSMLYPTSTKKYMTQALAKYMPERKVIVALPSFNMTVCIEGPTIRGVPRERNVVSSASYQAEKADYECWAHWARNHDAWTSLVRETL